LSLSTPAVASFAGSAKIIHERDGEFKGMSEQKETIQAGPQVPRRFTVPQRIEHFVLAASFTALGLTGLVQKFALNSVTDRIIDLLGGIQSTRIIHRASAVIFSLLAVYHAFAVAYKYFVRRVPMTMVPALKDITDGWHSFLYSVFLRKVPPKLPRYNFAEKLEYWALIWGGLIMVLTGFMLWNPLVTTRYLPGQVVPAAKAAHGGEAILAVLAILVWHFYNVHFKMFNKSMFTGKLTRHQMEEEHGAEWNEVLSGKTGPLPSLRSVRHRRYVFIPFAIIGAGIGVGSIYWAATAERTAISTLPAPVSRIAIYSPRAPASPAPTKPTLVSAPQIPHAIAGREQCYTCHGPKGMKPMPVNHEGRPIESCQICHKLSPVSERKKPVAEKATAGGPKPVPHPTSGEPFKNCLNCHGAGKVKPFPATHASFPVGSCTACHRPLSGDSNR
jgi:cytochrome b subunit of formate dehydrogenase